MSPLCTREVLSRDRTDVEVHSASWQIRKAMGGALGREPFTKKECGVRECCSREADVVLDPILGELAVPALPTW